MILVETLTVYISLLLLFSSSFFKSGRMKEKIWSRCVQNQRNERKRYFGCEKIIVVVCYFLHLIFSSLAARQISNNSGSLHVCGSNIKYMSKIIMNNVAKKIKIWSHIEREGNTKKKYKALRYSNSYIRKKKLFVALLKSPYLPYLNLSIFGLCYDFSWYFAIKLNEKWSKEKSMKDITAQLVVKTKFNNRSLKRKRWKKMKNVLADNDVIARVTLIQCFNWIVGLLHVFFTAMRWTRFV